MADRSAPILPVTRVPSGVPGLDVILQGGFLRGGVYLLLGQPGAGKTILAHQVSFAHIAAGGRALCVTLLAETHTRLITHLQALTFFDPRVIGDALYYINGHRTLEQEGLRPLLDLIRRTVQERQATLLVLEGFTTVEAIAESPLTLKQFMVELQVVVEASECTALLLSPTTDGESRHPAHTLVDGLIELRDDPHGVQTVRTLEVRKLRGSAQLRGRHFYTITDAGLVVYPRTEAVLIRSAVSTPPERRPVHVNVPGLDEMLRGNLLTGSTTMVLGAAGSGKTLLGLHFLRAGVQAQERGLYFGFHETPARLLARAQRLGLALDADGEGGAVSVHWQPPLEDVADALVERLLAAVAQHGSRRVVIDGLEGLAQAVVYPDRLPRVLAALFNELRARDVTTLATVELTTFFGPSVTVPLEGASALVENIFFLRYVELRAQLHRVLSILKLREGAYDTAIRAFHVTDTGIVVTEPMADAEALLTGLARPLAPVDAARAVPPHPQSEG